MIRSPAIEEMDANVRRIHDNYYAPKSKVAYMGHIRRFLLWLLEKMPSSLSLAYQGKTAADVKAIPDLATFSAGPFPLADDFSINTFEMYLTTLKTKTASNLQASSLGAHRSAFVCLFHSFKRQITVEASVSLASFFFVEGRERVQSREHMDLNLLAKERISLELSLMSCIDVSWIFRPIILLI
jgi:hypothetical protein